MPGNNFFLAGKKVNLAGIIHGQGKVGRVRGIFFGDIFFWAGKGIGPGWCGREGGMMTQIICHLGAGQSRPTMMGMLFTNVCRFRPLGVGFGKEKRGHVNVEQSTHLSLHIYSLCKLHVWGWLNRMQPVNQERVYRVSAWQPLLITRACRNESAGQICDTEIHFVQAWSIQLTPTRSHFKNFSLRDSSSKYSISL